MTSLHLVLLVFAFVCFVLAAIGVPTPTNPPMNRFNLIAAGLAFWVASTFLVR